MPDPTPPKPVPTPPDHVPWYRDLVVPLAVQFGCGAALALGLAILFRSR